MLGTYTLTNLSFFSGEGTSKNEGCQNPGNGIGTEAEDDAAAARQVEPDVQAIELIISWYK